MSLNKVMLIGRLGRDPEVRYMPNGDAVANFSIATEEKWKSQDGSTQSRTEWHNITIYRKLAEIAGQYLKKGSLVFLEGKIQSRKYQGKDGVERTAYDIICSEMKMLGSRDDNSGQHQSNQQGQYQSPQQQQQQQQQPPAPPTRQSPAQPTAPVDDIDDDIPF